MGSKINGTFKLSVSGDMDPVTAVEYRIDGQTLGTASESPFTLVFKTTDYPSGEHQLTAVVSLKDGSTVETPARNYNFISAGETGELVSGILLPVLGIAFGVMAVMMLLQFVVMRNRPLLHLEAGAQRNYGMKGGSVCKHCQRPFAFHWWALNLLPSMRFDRCDFCGKWGFHKAQPLNALRKAEQMEAEKARPSSQIPEKSEEEKLKEMMDRTKYMGQ
jgi:hypothetical protein